MCIAEVTTMAKCPNTGVPEEFCTCALNHQRNKQIEKGFAQLKELREFRCVFTDNIASLIRRAKVLGFDIAIDAAKVDAGLNDGRSDRSLHRLGLAADFNLYRDGVYLRDSEYHADLGKFWKQLHPLNRWGGDFRDKDGNPDGNHYSMEYQGRK
jgi:hypothetical protein